MSRDRNYDGVCFCGPFRIHGGRSAGGRLPRPCRQHSTACHGAGTMSGVGVHGWVLPVRAVAAMRGSVKDPQVRSTKIYRQRV